jgi:hypothetical protein
MIADGEIESVSLLTLPNLHGGPQIQFRSSAFFIDASIEIVIGGIVASVRRGQGFVFTGG